MYFAGGDWSGTPYRKARGTRPDFYVPGFVAFACPLEELAREIAAVKFQIGMPQSVEIHAHTLPEAVQYAFLRMAVNLEMRVGARIIDKGTAENPCGSALPLPADFAAQAALSVLAPFIERYDINSLWYDKDIQGPQREKEFETAVKRLNRERWLHGGLKARSKDSDKSELIQMADVAAYGIGRLAMNAIEHDALRRLVTGICSDSANTVVGPAAWKD